MQALKVLALPVDIIKCILLRAVHGVSPVRVARVMSVCTAFRDVLHNVSATQPTTTRPNSFDRLRIRDCAALRTLHISADRTVPLLHGPEDSERSVFDKARKAETQLTALKSVHMDSQPAEWDTLCHIILGAPGLETVVLHNMQTVEHYEECIRHLQAPRSLTITAYQITPSTDASARLFRLISSKQSLQSLRFTRMACYGLEHLSRLSALTCLHLSDSQSPSDAAVDHLLQHLPDLCDLKTDGFDEDDIDLSSIQGLSQLRTLCIEGQPVEGEGIYPITSAGVAHLTSLPTLATLTLKWCGDGAIQHLATCPTLKSLCLTWIYEPDQACTRDMNDLEKLTALHSLKICCEHTVNDSDLESIAKVSALTCLDVEVKENVMEGFAALAQMPRLQKLTARIQGCMTSIQAKLVASIPLRSLDLTVANINFESARSLAAMHMLTHLKLTLDTSSDVPGEQNDFNLSPLLTATKPRWLELEDWEFDDTFVDRMSALTALTRLTLRGIESITSASLYSLTHAPELQWVEFYQCAHIDPHHASLCFQHPHNNIGYVHIE